MEILGTVQLLKVNDRQIISLAIKQIVNIKRSAV